MARLNQLILSFVLSQALVTYDAQVSVFHKSGHAHFFLFETPFVSSWPLFKFLKLAYYLFSRYGNLFYIFIIYYISIRLNYCPHGWPKPHHNVNIMFNEDIFCKYVILQSTYCIYISVQKVPLDYYMYIVHDIFVGKIHIFIKKWNT